mgnify:CR=1 FL=1
MNVLAGLLRQDVEGGQRIMEFPELQWVHLEMEAQLGGHSPGTWTLKVTLPDQPARVFEGIKFNHPEAKSLEWLGFSSPGTAVASYWSDWRGELPPGRAWRCSRSQSGPTMTRRRPGPLKLPP